MAYPWMLCSLAQPLSFFSKCLKGSGFFFDLDSKACDAAVLPFSRAEAQ